MEYFREELFPCVSLTAVQTDKFKTGCMTAYLLTQLHRETAAENAVLPYVLRRGTKSLPDMPCSASCGYPPRRAAGCFCPRTSIPSANSSSSASSA